MDRTTRATWEKRIERWKDSGLSAAEYSRELGISSRTLKWWCWKLSSDAKPAPTLPKLRRARRARVATKSDAKQSVAPLTFVEVATPLQPPTASAATPIEIVLRSGVQLRVTIGFDAPTLARVLDVVERRS